MTLANTTYTSFNIPTDLTPVNKSTSTSSGSGSSQAGINWKNPLAAAMQPLLIQSGQQLPGVVDNMGATLQGQYANAMRSAMSPNMFQGTLNQLANRGMLNSSVAADALASAQNQAAQDIANQGFTSQLAQQTAQMQLPETLGNLAKLAEESSSVNRSNTASQSLQTDPLAPYELIAKMMMY
jgi:hypothetical protein